VLEEFDITAKLFCITTDNASNNGTMMRELSKRLEDEKGIIWDAKQHHIACLSHVINLIVTDFMKAIKGLRRGQMFLITITQTVEMIKYKLILKMESQKV
jgi:hypothetical protein